jgi:Uma2 family endonuclease
MATVSVKLTPADHGRRMSLDDFEFAEVQEGKLYQLGRGVVIVSDVPKPPHARQQMAIRKQLSRYDDAHPGLIHAILEGSACKILVRRFESERHPDVAVYLTPWPAEDDTVWRKWVPEILIEIVSLGSERRDYEDKREEYLALGVKEYWIFNADRQEMLVLRRRGGRWSERTLTMGDVYQTRLLPGLEFEVSPVFEAALPPQ